MPQAFPEEQPNRFVPRKMLVLTYLLVTVAYLTLTAGHLYTCDSEMSYYTTESLVRTQSLVIPSSVISVTSVEGYQTGRHGIIQPILCIPFYLLGALLDNVYPDPFFLKENWRITLVCTFNQWLSPLAVTLMLQILFYLTGRLVPSLVASLVFAFSTPWITYAGDLFRQPLAGVLFLWVIWEAIKFSDHRRPGNFVAAGLGVGLSFANRITAVICWPGMLYLLLGPFRKVGLRRLVKIGLIVVVLAALGVAVQFAINYIRFGHWWGWAYEEREFSLRFLRETVPEFLFSPARSLLLFAPPIIFVIWGLPAMWRVNRHVTIGLALMIFAKLAMFCTYYDFRGGVNPGPRYLIPILPVIFLFVGACVTQEWHQRSFRWSLYVLAGLGAVVNGFNSIIWYQRTLTFWEQLLRWVGFENYVQWPAWDTRADLDDVLIGYWFFEGYWVPLLVFLGVMCSLTFFLAKWLADETQRHRVPQT